MGSSQNKSAAHLENMRQRRMNRIRRQRAIEAGKPVDTFQKAMALSSVQKKELSGLPLHAHGDQKHQDTKRGGLSVLVSLGLHAIVVFIAAFYVVRTAQVDDEAVSVEFFQEILEKRDPPIRKVRVRSTPQPTRQPQVLKQPVLKPVVNLPKSDDGFDIPEEGLDNVPDLGPSDAGSGIDTSGIDNRLSPVKPKFDTGTPEDIIRPKSDDSTLGGFGEPLDIDQGPDPDFGKGVDVQPQEVKRRPQWRKQVEPKYPSAARRAQKEGKVVLLATIDVDGKAKDIEVKEDTVGFGCARSAIEALEASRFSPAKKGEESVSIRISIPYQFKLDD